MTKTTVFADTLRISDLALCKFKRISREQLHVRTYRPTELGGIMLPKQDNWRPNATPERLQRTGTNVVAILIENRQRWSIVMLVIQVFSGAKIALISLRLLGLRFAL